MFKTLGDYKSKCFRSHTLEDDKRGKEDKKKKSEAYSGGESR